MTTTPSMRRRPITHVGAIAVAAALAVGWAASPVQAGPITDENVAEAVEAAKTPADHQALAAYFTEKAKQARANIAYHQRMSKMFGGKGHAAWESHCQSLMKSFEKQAEDYEALAKEQAAVAAALEKQ